MSGKITNNNGDLSKAFFGSAEVNKIYLGNTELYSKAAPVSYVIPAGLYYGKASPDVDYVINELGVETFNITFNIGNSSGFSIGFGLHPASEGYGIYYGVINGIPPVFSTQWVYDGSSWTTSYRTIEVAFDTTVTHAQYEAFFACFDYAFVVHAATFPVLEITYGYQPQVMTWSEFVASNYNDGTFSISPNGNVIYRQQLSFLNSSGGSDVHASDYIVNGRNYFAGGGSND